MTEAMADEPMTEDSSQQIQETSANTGKEEKSEAKSTSITSEESSKGAAQQPEQSTPSQTATTEPSDGGVRKDKTESKKSSSKASGVHKKGTSSKKMGFYLSTMQKQKVDEAFLAMFGYPWGTRPEVDASTQRVDRRYGMLKRIFGPRSAAQILHNCKTKDSTLEVADEAIKTQLVPVHSNIPGPIKTASTKTTEMAPTPAKPSTQEISNCVGGDESAISGVSNAPVSTGATGGGGGGGGVDALLEQIQGPKGTSTIFKTAMDWESFKEKSGALGEKLEQHAESKGAYLKRQDFLNRVDHRQFEQERQERERNRARKS